MNRDSLVAFGAGLCGGLAALAIGGAGCSSRGDGEITRAQVGARSAQAAVHNGVVYLSGQVAVAVGERPAIC